MRFPKKGRKKEDVLREIYSMRDKDLNYSRIIGTMTPKPDPDLIKIYSDFLETNLGDPKNFPGTREIERNLIEMVLDLFNAPPGAGGRVVSGGTEGNMLAIALAKHLSGGREVVIPDYAHFSFQKIAKIMGVRLRVIKTRDFVIDPKSLSENIDRKTSAVVAVAGSTELGLVDPIPEISDICYDNNVFLHVDAAFGGFIIPFLRELGYEVPEIDFSLEGVSTISADGHKMGGCAIPLGFLLSRNEDWFNSIGVETPYVSTGIQSTILGTRTGGPIAYGYAKFNILGKEGFLEISKRCMDLTDYTRSKLEERGFNVVVNPNLNVLAVKVDNMDRIVKELYLRGWSVNPIKRLSAFRIVIMPYMDREMIDEFIEDLYDVHREVK